MSGKYSYQNFIQEFEKTLPCIEESICRYSKKEIELLLIKDLFNRILIRVWKSIQFRFKKLIGKS